MSAIVSSLVYTLLVDELLGDLILGNIRDKLRVQVCCSGQYYSLLSTIFNYYAFHLYHSYRI